MSIYQFLASDDPMKTIKNQKIELLSIEEAEARGLSMPTTKRCQIDSLTVSIIKETVEQDPYEKPCCLIVCK